jgi:hypothetical protein
MYLGLKNKKKPMQQVVLNGLYIGFMHKAMNASSLDAKAWGE